MRGWPRARGVPKKRSSLGASGWSARRDRVVDIPEALWRVCSLIFAQPPAAAPGPCACCSFQMMTLPSYEHDARIWPNFGCAQATCHTGPVWLVPWTHA